MSSPCPPEPDFDAATPQLPGRLKWSSQAIPWYRAALAAHPSPDIASELAECLMEEGRADESIAILEPFTDKLPSDHVTHVLLAQAYTECRQFDRAEELWASTARHTSDPAGWILKRATAEIYAGRISVAEELLRGALARYPEAPRIYARLVAVRKMTVDDQPFIEEMERLQSDSRPDSDAHVELCFALGKAYHDLCDYGKAIAFYDEANWIVYRDSPSVKAFDRTAWRAYIDLQIQFFTKERLRSLASLGLASRTPLFVVGMIRSGTTLTEQILSNHSQVQAGGETTYWPDHREELFDASGGRFDTSAAKRLGAEFLRLRKSNRPSDRYVTEKNPSNVFLAAMLHCVYPNAKFLHVKRHPVDNLLSTWMTPLRTGLPFVNHRENLVFAYREYLRLWRHLEDVMPADRFKTYAYEDITASPSTTIESMLGFLDLEAESACFHPESNPRTVRTPSFYQVRQPINMGSTARWKMYEPWLGSFAELLDERD